MTLDIARRGGETFVVLVDLADAAQKGTVGQLCGCSGHVDPLVAHGLDVILPVRTTTCLPQA
jgi:hypothetical protein